MSFGVICLYVALVAPLVFSSPTLSIDLEDLRQDFLRAERNFALPKGFDNDNFSPRIIGGDVAPASAYPSQAALLIYAGVNVYFCGGSLISPQYVLTAAHCVDMKPSYILVVLGTNNLDTLDASAVVLNATKYKYHSSWVSETFQNDVGLVKLPRNVTYNTNIQPITFANGTDTYADVNGTTVGWGETETVSLSTVLMLVNTTIMKNDVCAEYNSDYKSLILPMHMCTSGNGTKGSCSGDSGGPLIVGGIQVGIVSFGPTDCLLGWPSVYTRITEYNDWIVEHAVDGTSSHHGACFALILSLALCFARLFK